MRMHVLQHVPYEGPDNIEVWALGRGFTVSRTRFWLDEPLPAPDEPDWLVIMGGPMSVHDEREYPWLVEEKRLVRETIRCGRKTFGICLGAQLIAEVLGGAVRRNPQKEIGWFPIQLTGPGSVRPPFDALPRSFVAFHWHGETFDLPPGAEHAGQSEACANQAFVFGANVVGLQFHLECSPGGIEGMLRHGIAEIVPGPHVQTPEAIFAGAHTPAQQACLTALLDGINGIGAV